MPLAKEPICVFCASSPGNKPVYEQAAISVGRALSENGNQCVYGGGVRGLMGTVSSACLEAGGQAHGIIPAALTGRAAEKAVREARSQPDSGTATPASLSSSSAAAQPVEQSKEGSGKTVLEGDESDYDGRYTNEVVKTMHERKLRMAKISTGGFIVLPGGFGTFEEVMEMIELAVAEGFITFSNMSLIKFVDLQPGDSEERDWGKRCMEALDSWVWDESAGYNLQWKEGN
ncbi:hypothetical protein QFC24_003661 [Naganishia onofrii]|uniref:Uncharacterized protein n=1 Tax=Naganishia onofrii TaxID=1851511 RepID=A0ACC2XJI0_9TREE|nr:hypothetical protein QFC24_003661 [Naganishia onofrii]